MAFQIEVLDYIFTFTSISNLMKTWAWGCDKAMPRWWARAVEDSEVTYLSGALRQDGGLHSGVPPMSHASFVILKVGTSRNDRTLLYLNFSII